MIDDVIGHVLSTLQSTGLAENTVVIFTTDHGDFMGDHQLLLKAAVHCDVRLFFAKQRAFKWAFFCV